MQVFENYVIIKKVQKSTLLKKYKKKYKKSTKKYKKKVQKQYKKKVQKKYKKVQKKYIIKKVRHSQSLLLLKTSVIVIIKKTRHSQSSLLLKTRRSSVKSSPLLKNTSSLYAVKSWLFLNITSFPRINRLISRSIGSLVDQ